MHNLEVEKKLFERLQALLPRAAANMLEQLVEVLTSFELPEQSPLLPLLEVKCTAAEIHQSLIHCRTLMLAMYGQASGAKKSLVVQKIILQHDRLVMLLLQNINDLHEQTCAIMEAKLLHEGHERIVGKAVAAWKLEKEVQLYNYYKEVPVHAEVSLLHVDEQDLSVRKSLELVRVFTASEQGNTALIRLPKNELCMRLTIDEVSDVGVHLRYGGFLSADREKRRSMRVQSDKPIVVALTDEKGETWQSVMHDFSDSGMGLLFDEKAPFQVGDTVDLSLLMNKKLVEAKGVVYWVNNRSGRGALGIGIEYSNENFRLFSNEVIRRKKEILNELKHLKVLPSLL